MSETAQNDLDETARDSAPLPADKGIVAKLKSINKYRCAAGFGVISIALYAFLYFYNSDLTQIAQATHEGEKTWFFVPIVIALVFSQTHHGRGQNKCAARADKATDHAADKADHEQDHNIEHVQVDKINCIHLRFTPIED